MEGTYWALAERELSPQIVSSDGTACDGSVLHFGGVQSMCCENNAYWGPCADPPCSNYDFGLPNSDCVSISIGASHA